MHDEFELFKGTTFSDLMKDIYHNSKKKDRQINTLIQELQPLIKNIGDATVIVPLIKEYLDVSVKNDEHLVRLHIGLEDPKDLINDLRKALKLIK